MARAFWLLLLLLAPAACAAPTVPEDAGNLSPNEGASTGLLTTDRAEYRVGDTAGLILRNTTSKVIGYNLCSSWWEIWTGSAWREIHPLRVCTRELRLLKPGESATWEERITAEWRAGQYRFGTTIWIGAGESSTRVHTPTFRVGQ